MAIIGFIVLAVAAYGIFRAIVHAAEAIMHTVIEIIEITAVTIGSIGIAALLILIAIRVSRRRHSRPDRDGLKVLAINLASPPPAAHHTALPAVNPARLFAEAVTSPDMDPRFVERILRNVMNGTDQ